MPLCSVKDMPESSWVSVATGQFFPSNVPSFAWKRTSLWILSWKQILLGSITGSPPAWKILTCLFSISYVIVKSVLSAFEDTPLQQNWRRQVSLPGH